MTITRVGLWLAGILALLGCTLPASACPFCSQQGRTLTNDVADAAMVLYGTLKNAKLDPNGEFGQGTTELHIETVIKKHDILGDKKMIVLPRYVPSDKDKPAHFLIFCDVFKGKIDPYRGVPLKEGSDMVRYLTGLMKLKEKDVAGRLRFAFDFLDNADVEVSNDAYKEFGNADYKDYRDLAKTLPPEKIAKWLEDPNTPPFRFGTYGSLLGHCGTEKHADLLRAMLDDPMKRVTSGVDGILAGYVMLKPKEGWEYVRGIAGNAKKDFLFRYNALRTMRFFWDFRPDVIRKEELQKGVELLLDQGDIADIPIEDLRKWKRWDALDRIIALMDRDSHQAPIVRRAIVKFAMSCPDKKAADFVKQMRAKDAEFVADVEEVLKLETASKPQTEVKK